MTINIIMEKAKNTMPMAMLPQGRKECKKESPTLGRSNILCARRDNTPAESNRVFLTESRDIVFKSIAQKMFFFYQVAILYMTRGPLLGYFQS
jgi:hypothetical protein